MPTIPETPNPKKPFIVANVLDLTDIWNKGDVTFSRMVEIMNEMVTQWKEQHESDPPGDQQPDLQELWDEFSMLADRDVDNLYDIAGTTIMRRKDFDKMLKQYHLTLKQ